ncbi:MAG: septum formation initiator family protein [Pseudomonadota bacterium]
MRSVIVIGLALFVVLQLKLWAGDGSLPAQWELERALATQHSENELLAERNARLAAEVNDLKTGVQEVEARARRELGMIAPGETFFLLTDQP